MRSRRSTSTRLICARRCAASTASGRPARTRTIRPRSRACHRRARPIRSSCRACAHPNGKQQPAAGRSAGRAGRGLYRPRQEARRDRPQERWREPQGRQDQRRDRQGRQRRADQQPAQRVRGGHAACRGRKPSNRPRPPQAAPKSTTRHERRRREGRPPNRTAPKKDALKKDALKKTPRRNDGVDGLQDPRRADSADRADRLPGRRQDHAAQPPAAGPGARRHGRHHQRVRRDRARSSPGRTDRRQHGAAAERLPVLHAARRPRERARKRCCAISTTAASRSAA